MDKQTTLSKATKRLLLKYPFYGFFLIHLNKEWSDKIDTMGVSKNGINFQLSINPDFWEELSADYRLGLLQHDVLHVCNNHLNMAADYPNKKVFALATDIQVNQFIEREYLPGGTFASKEQYQETIQPYVDSIKERLDKGEITPEQAKKEEMKVPPRAVFLEDFPDLNLEPKKGADYYYRKLMESMDNQGNSSSPNVDQLLNPGTQSNPHHSHESWNEFENMSDTERKLLNNQTDHLLKEVAKQVQKSRGTIPAHLKNYIDGLFETAPAKFNWKAYLRQFANGGTKSYTRKSKRKQSKRFEGQPGIKVEYVQHILVALDTSGSVSDDEVHEFFNEIDHIHKTGVDVTVVQCDTRISSIEPYKKPKDGKIRLTSRGGTNFSEPVAYFNKHKNKFSSLIYLTDGEAPAPEEKVKGRCLWVLSSQSNETDHLPGNVIKLS